MILAKFRISALHLRLRTAFIQYKLAYRKKNYSFLEEMVSNVIMNTLYIIYEVLRSFWKSTSFVRFFCEISVKLKKTISWFDVILNTLYTETNKFLNNSKILKCFSMVSIQKFTFRVSTFLKQKNRWNKNKTKQLLIFSCSPKKIEPLSVYKVSVRTCNPFVIATESIISSLRVRN